MATWRPMLAAVRRCHLRAPPGFICIDTSAPPPWVLKSPRASLITSPPMGASVFAAFADGVELQVLLALNYVGLHAPHEGEVGGQYGAGVGAAEYGVHAGRVADVGTQRAGHREQAGQHVFLGSSRVGFSGSVFLGQLLGQRVIGGGGGGGTRRRWR